MRVKFEGYDENRIKCEREIYGELIKETEKQIIVKQPDGSTATINKLKIISRDDVVLSIPKECNDSSIVNLENYQKYTELCNKIIVSSNEVLKGFLGIGRALKIIEEKSLYLLDGYSNFYEFCEKKFNYKETSVKNMIAVYKKYKSNDTDDDSYFVSLDEKYKDFSYTALVEMLPVPEKEIEKKYSPDMSVAKIREVKTISQLTDDLQLIINRFNHVVKLLTAEVENFNKEYKKKIIKIVKDSSNSLKIDNYYQRVTFEHSYHEYSISSSLSNPLQINWKKNEFISDEDLIKNFNNKFLKFVKSDLKEKEKEQEKNNKKAEEKKEYEDVSYYFLNENGFAYINSVYLYFKILVLGDFEYYNSYYYFRKYLNSSEYKKELIYNAESIGNLCINPEEQYIYLDLPNCDDETLKRKYHYEKETLYEVVYDLGNKLIKYLKK